MKYESITEKAVTMYIIRSQQYEDENASYINISVREIGRGF